MSRSRKRGMTHRQWKRWAATHLYQKGPGPGARRLKILRERTEWCEAVKLGLNDQSREELPYGLWKRGKHVA